MKKLLWHNIGEDTYLALVPTGVLIQVYEEKGPALTHIVCDWDDWARMLPDTAFTIFPESEYYRGALT